MILLVHPSGNQNSRHAARALSQAGISLKFFTSIHVDSGNIALAFSPAGVRKWLSRRSFSEYVGGNEVKSVAVMREVVRLVSSVFDNSYFTRSEGSWASVDSVYRSVDKAVAAYIRSRPEAIKAVYAYEDGALESFKAAKEFGITRIYELPIGYWKAHRVLCEEESTLQPRWASTWIASRDSEKKLKRKDCELSMATHVIVPSSFVRSTLELFRESLPPISVIPYGCPTPISESDRSWYSGGNLRVLFVGGLSQRKGLSYLLDAVESFDGAIELTVIGAGAGLENIKNVHRVLGSISHAEVLEEMQRHDVFVFPTLFEGYSLAIAEALSQGLPVITTLNSGVSEIIEDGEQGWIVPVRDSEAIAEKLQDFIDSPERVLDMGRSALKLAEEWTWVQYRECLLSEVNRILAVQK